MNFLCSLHEENLHGMCNFSSAFIQGIIGSALKKDNVTKHGMSDMHYRAASLERKSTMMLSQIYHSTPLGKAMS